MFKFQQILHANYKENSDLVFRFFAFCDRTRSLECCRWYLNIVSVSKRVELVENIVHSGITVNLKFYSSATFIKH